MGNKKQETGNNYEFKAEVRQLLYLLTHSLYAHRDIFIRELISNAVDALDKVRFKSIKGEEIADPELDFEIRIESDKDKKIMTISDTGIGMTKQELIDNIGTIARSGTMEFVKQLAREKDTELNLIGRFGVGFYSVFMAGEKVNVSSRSYQTDESPHVWSSDGEGSFEVKQAEDRKRGTSIQVFLREDAKEFTEKDYIESIIKKYSNFVPFPIFLNGDRVNKLSAIWREPKTSVTDEKYNEFFKFIANQSDEPFARMHLTADAPIQFHCLLFVPKTNMESLGFGIDEEGIQLFARRVLVDAHAKDVLPGYLRFVRGVLDSDDLPLNISRETLQENPYIVKIKNTIISKFLSHLQEIAKNEPDKYHEIWKAHGRVFKEGHTDIVNSEKISGLFRFNSSKCHDGDELISLQSYVDRMAADQEEIYYLSGPTRDAIEKNPNMEIFRSRDIEVLYCYDPIDEFVFPYLNRYKEKRFVSADQAEPAKLSKKDDQQEAEEKETPPSDAQVKGLDRLARRMKDILGDKVEDVRLSERLVESPAIMVAATPGMSSQMEKFMQQFNEDVKIAPKIMEINTKHPLIKNMLAIYEKDVKDPFLEKLVNRLFDSIRWLDGYVEDIQASATGLQELLHDSAELYLDAKKEK